MLRAEMYARYRASALARKGSHWRTTSPSTKQLNLCRYRGIRVKPGWTAGDVSDALDIHEASTALDKHIRAVALAA
jgi:hypothetical protein